MQGLKKFIINHVSESQLTYLILVSKYKRKFKSLFKTGIFALKARFKFYAPNMKFLKGKQDRKVFEKVKINLSNSNYFAYNIDIFKTTVHENRMMENITIDYSKVLKKSLFDLKKENDKMKDSNYKESQKELLNGIEEYLDKECEYLQNSNHPNKDNIIKYLNNFKNKKATSFEEALQRILFYNQLLWQTGHTLNGLGRLDKILDKYYQNDINSKKITKEKAKLMILDFIKLLHQNFWLKSNTLLGDTGQIIILGGKEMNGDYFCNDLTYLFIEATMEAHLPDPKILLRVTDKLPRDLMELSLNCIKTGIGCPLFSNDDVVIPKLIEFGYIKEDAYNYVTAACWEPLIAGKSVEQNNIDSIVYLTPFNKMLDTEDLKNIKTYDEFGKKYKKYLKEYLINFTDNINKINWEEAPLLSLVTDDCNKKCLDASMGGCIYNNYGLTAVSLGSVVNSLYNIKKFVFEDKKYTLEKLNEIRQNNFENNEEALSLLKKQPNRYGTDNEEIINITNDIASFTNGVFDNIKNKFNGAYKFGFSAPSYITSSTDSKASFDGRKDGEPFGVHISTDKPSVAYTEIIQFASKLKYDGHRFNGNVVDFMITPSFIEDNFDKMIDFLMLSISLGFFQMQMNVTSSEILIKAKENPKDYENLIVRVWGFSAYFNDLPNNYKELLIERALKNEGKIN